MIFLDAGPIFARVQARDAHHEAALMGWEELERSGRRVLTSNLVLAEAVLRRWLHHFS